MARFPLPLFGLLVILLLGVVRRFGYSMGPACRAAAPGPQTPLVARPVSRSLNRKTASIVSPGGRHYMRFPENTAFPCAA